MNYDEGYVSGSNDTELIRKFSFITWNTKNSKEIIDEFQLVNYSALLWLHCPQQNDSLNLSPTRKSYHSLSSWRHCNCWQNVTRWLNMPYEWHNNIKSRTIRFWNQKKALSHFKSVQFYICPWKIWNYWEKFSKYFYGLSKA